MLFWGLANRELDEAIELYTAGAAEQALLDVLTDQATWEHLFFVAPVELAGPENSQVLRTDRSTAASCWRTLLPYANICS